MAGNPDHSPEYDTCSRLYSAGGNILLFQIETYTGFPAALQSTTCCWLERAGELAPAPFSVPCLLLLPLPVMVVVVLLLLVVLLPPLLLSGLAPPQLP